MSSIDLLIKFNVSVMFIFCFYKESNLKEMIQFSNDPKCRRSSREKT